MLHYHLLYTWYYIRCVPSSYNKIWLKFLKYKSDVCCTLSSYRVIVIAYAQISAHNLQISHRYKKGANKTIHKPCLQHSWETRNVTNFSLHVSREQASKAQAHSRAQDRAKVRREQRAHQQQNPEGYNITSRRRKFYLDWRNFKYRDETGGLRDAKGRGRKMHRSRDSSLREVVVSG